MLFPNPGTPTVYVVDTEFAPFKTEEVTEIAFVNVSSGQVMVHGIFQEHRALELRLKMAGSRLHYRTSGTENAHQVETVKAAARQIRNCRFKPNDIIIEYSSYSKRAPLDMRKIRHMLQYHGFNDRELIPDTIEHTCEDNWTRVIRRFFSQVLPLSCWKLQYLFRILFPRDPLVDKHHSAVIDCLQLARIVRLIAELAKRPEDRVLPSDLLQGLDGLLPLGKVEHKDSVRSLSSWLEVCTPLAQPVHPEA